MSHTQALAVVGADAVFYFESKPDRNALLDLLKRFGKESLVARARVESLGGFGNAKKLSGALEVIKRLRRLKLAVVAFLDADYTQANPNGTWEMEGDVLVMRLPGKELENLLLLSPQAIADAALDVAQRRRQASGSEIRTPSVDEVTARIDRETEADDIRGAVRPHWVWRRSQEEGVDLNAEGTLKRIEDDFEECWKGAEWRRRRCPGKTVLKRVRHWIQREYNLSLGYPVLFKHYQPSSELRRLFDKLEAHVEHELT